MPVFCCLGSFQMSLEYFCLLTGFSPLDKSHFITVYNKEVSIQAFRNYKPQIIQSLKVLNGKQIINGALSAEIDDLRMYRNGLVHGVDFKIPQSACDRVAEIYNAINKVYEIYKKDSKETNALNAAIKEVYDLTNRDATSY